MILSIIRNQKILNNKPSNITITKIQKRFTGNSTTNSTKEGKQIVKQVLTYTKEIPPRRFRKFEYANKNNQSATPAVFPIESDSEEPLFIRTERAKKAFNERATNTTTIGVPTRYIAPADPLTRDQRERLEKYTQNKNNPIVNKTQGGVKDDIRDNPSYFANKNAEKILNSTPYHHQIVVPENVLINLTSNMPSKEAQLNKRMVVLTMGILVDSEGKEQLVASRYHYPDDPVKFYNIDPRAGSLDEAKTSCLFCTDNHDLNLKNLQIISHMVTGYKILEARIKEIQIMVKDRPLLARDPSITAKEQKIKNEASIKKWISSLSFFKELELRVEEHNRYRRNDSKALVVIPSKDDQEEQKNPLNDDIKHEKE